MNSGERSRLANVSSSRRNALLARLRKCASEHYPNENFELNSL